MEEKVDDEDQFIKENPIIFKKYRVKKKLGEGAFGDVYLGQSISDNSYVAIKTEPRKIIKPILETEAFLLYSIAGPGIPQVKSYGKTKKYNILVEPLLGKSLFDIFTENHRSMHLADVCLIANQVIDRIQWVHSKNIVHRDIKPDNFLIGRKDPNVIYLIDFGLSKKFRSSTTGKHIKFGFTGKLTGTVRFASANALRGGEQSRRDDIESIGYMMVYFLKKKLPWQGVSGNKKMERYLKIYKMKKNITPEKLCEGLEHEMVEFISYAKNLEFEQEPDYNYLKNLFKKMLTRIHTTNDQLIFSWIKMKDFAILKDPINPASRKDSPQNRIYKKIKSQLEKGKNLSSDSDSKPASYTQINNQLVSSVIMNTNNNNPLLFSEDQLEMPNKNKNNVISMKSKEILNTTNSNLEFSFDDKMLALENEKTASKDKDILGKGNKDLNIINKNLDSEFNKKNNQEPNKIENNDKIINKDNNENENNKKNLSNNIIDISKEKGNQKEIKNLLNSELNQKMNKNNNEAKKTTKNNKINDFNINKDIPKIVLDGIDFTFNETITINTNNSNKNTQLNKNLTEKKEKNPNLENVDTNNEKMYKLLTGKNLKSNEKKKKRENLNNSVKNSNINKEKSNRIYRNDNINIIKNKNIKTKPLKRNEKKFPFNNITGISKKKINIDLNQNFNKTIVLPNNNEFKNNKQIKQEDDIIKQISNEKNNNLYNVLKEEDFNININELRKRPSAGPVFNPLSLNKTKFNKENNINFQDNMEMNKILNKNNQKNINIGINKSKMQLIKNNKTIVSNSLNFMNENNNALLNLNNYNNSNIVNIPPRERKIEKLNHKTIYKGIGFKTYENVINFEQKEENLTRNKFPEDNIMEGISKSKSKNKNTNNKDKVIGNSNNKLYKSFNNQYPMNNENMNNIESNLSQKNYIKHRNNESPIIVNRINKNMKVVRLNNPKINNNNMKAGINTNKAQKIKRMNDGRTPQIKIINNNNYNQVNNFGNNTTNIPNNNLLYKSIIPNSQINYQFPVYINNNNNIYNTQYLNTVGNFPINSNIKQINQKFITISPTPIQTSLNFGQNIGVQFVNNTPNFHNNYKSMRYYPMDNKNIYEYQKKFNA